MDGQDFTKCTLTYWEANEEKFKQQFEDYNNWKMIPSLNSIALQNVEDQQLVRFVGMIQDMQNPEMFLEQYEVKDSCSLQTRILCSRYREMTSCNAGEVIVEDSVNNVMKERQVLSCISIPALNKWVKEFHDQEANSITLQPTTSNESVIRVNKRTLPDESACEMLPSNSDLTIDNNKRLCPTFQSVSINPDNIKNINLPISDSASKTCLIKVYDQDTTLALNDVVEVIGFYSMTPVMNLESLNEDIEMEEESVNSHNHPGSLVSILHAIKLRKLNHCNPLLPELSAEPNSFFDLANNAWKELRLVFSQILLGDQLAADYLICHLISRVYQRSDLLALGRFSLNISNIPLDEDYVEKFYRVLEKLLTKSHFLPLTLDNLNKGSFIPKKDYDANKLVSGLLQLSPNTHLVLDETRLQAGQLDTNGVHNVAALGTLISQQKVDYDFKFYKLEILTDVPVLVFSEGKSFLPNDVTIPLECDPTCMNTRNEIFEIVHHYLNQDLLQRIRKYLTSMCFMEYSLPKDLEQVIQDDFVKIRKENGIKFSGSDLHLLLVLARLLSLSQGENTLSKKNWELACQMEAQRKQRVSGQRRPS